jgi:hypothetical protein
MQVDASFAKNTVSLAVLIIQAMGSFLATGGKSER